MARRLIVLALALLVVPLLFAACGDDDDDDTSAAETAAAEDTAAEDDAAEESSGGGETIQISETEFAIDPSDVSAAAGDVSFEVTNDGSIPHDLEVEGNGVEEVTPTIDPGGTETLTASLEAGTYELYCTIGDHADQGMTGELTVE